MQKGYRPCHGGADRYAKDPYWKDLLLFHEYFHEEGVVLGELEWAGWEKGFENGKYRSCWN